MAGGGEGDGPGRDVEDAHQGGGQASPDAGQADAVESLQGLPGGLLFEEKEAEGVAQPAHDPGRPDVVTFHVTDDEGDVVLADRHDVVPVAADLQADCGGVVAGGHVPAVDGRDGVRQQVPLELVRNPTLAVVGPGPDHDGADLRGQLLGQHEILLGEPAARAGRDEGDGAEDLLVAQAERHRDVGGEAERLQNGVMPLVPARGPEELVVHVGAPHRPAAPDDLHGRMGAGGVRRIRRTQLLGERPLVRVGVPGGHPPHAAVLVRNVDEAEVRHHRHRDLGEPFHHFAVVEDLRQHLGGQEEELVVAPGVEELLDEMLTFHRLGRRVQQLAEMVADRVHELDDGRIALALVPAQHFDDPDTDAVVADGEGERALQPVAPECVRGEAPIGTEVGDPQGLVVFEDPLRETRTAAGRITRFLLYEGGCDVRAPCPHVPADQLPIGRQGPQRRHVPVQVPAQRREDALGRWLVDRGVGQDLEQLARELGPALQPLLVTGADDADHDRAGDRVLENADDQLGTDIGAVGPLDVDIERAADHVRSLGAHEGPVVLTDGRGQRIGHEVEDGSADQCAAGPPEEILTRLVDVENGAHVVGGDHGVA